MIEVVFEPSLSKYQVLVVLKHHRRLWANIFDTDISRSIYTQIKVKYNPLIKVFMPLGSYGASNLPKPNENNFKHYLYCCI